MDGLTAGWMDGRTDRQADSHTDSSRPLRAQTHVTSSPAPAAPKGRGLPAPGALSAPGAGPDVTPRALDQ